MMYIRQGATHKVTVGPVVAVGDGFTPVTTLALSTADEAEAILHDNGTVVDISGYTWAAITTADGYYHLTLQSGISNTVGHLTIVVNDDSLVLPVRADFTVLEEAAYDQLFAASAPGAATVAALATVDTNVDAILVDTGTTLQAELDGIQADTEDIQSRLPAALVGGKMDADATSISGSATAAATLEAQMDAYEEGTAQAGAAGTITLRSGASATNDYYNGQAVWITGGTGAGQFRIIDDYVGSTKVASVSPNWATNPDATSVYVLAGAPSSTASPPDVNVTQVAGQTASAAAGVDFDDIAAILVDTAEIGVAGAGLTEAGGTGDQLTALATAAALATVDGNVDAILVDTGTTLPGTLSDMSGATFDTSTDSLEAIRNRGDSAWTTGAGGTPPQLLQNTTIATLASQTSFTLTAGSADDDAYNNAIVVITDSATSTQKAVGTISDYVGATRTVTLAADPGIFTMATGDTVDVIASTAGLTQSDVRAAVGLAANNLDTQLAALPTAAENRAEIDSNSTQLAAILADTGTDIPATLATIAGYIDTEVAAILEDTGTTLPATLAQIVAAVITNATGADIAADIIALDAVADAIKAKTDSLTFTKAGEVDANTQSINGATLIGDGSATPFDVA